MSSWDERRLTPMRALRLLREVEQANRGDQGQMKWALNHVAVQLEAHVKLALRRTKRRNARPAQLRAIAGGKR